MNCYKYKEGGMHQELLELIQWDTEHLWAGIRMKTIKMRNILNNMI